MNQFEKLVITDEIRGEEIRLGLAKGSLAPLLDLAKLDEKGRPYFTVRDGVQDSVSTAATIFMQKFPHTAGASSLPATAKMAQGFQQNMERQANDRRAVETANLPANFASMTPEQKIAFGYAQNEQVRASRR